MSQSEKQKILILNCEQNVFAGEYIPAAQVIKTTPENALLRKARKNQTTKRKDEGIEI